MIRTKQQRRRDRRTIDKANAPLTPMTGVVSVTASGASQVTVLFAGPVQISSGNLPLTWHYGTTPRTITSIVSTDGTSYVFGLSGTAASTEAYAMPGSDPAARTPLGGYVSSSTGVIA